MKILQFCKKSPIPPRDGESIAIHQLSKVIATNQCELTVFSILTQKHKEKNHNFQLKNVDYHFEKIDTSISYFAVLKNLLFSKKPYNVKRFANKKIEQKLTQLLKENSFDIVQLEGVFLGIYIDIIRKYSKAKIVLRAHNVEHQIWKRLAENKSFINKWYLQYNMIPRLKQFEDQVINQVDMIVSISKVDSLYFKSINPNIALKTIPASCEIKAFIPPLPKDFHIGFIGGLDWLPNAEGVNWFLEKIWNPFVALSPNSKFNLAGRNFPKRYYDLQHKNLFIYGEVIDAQAFTYENSLMIAPILSGSGMRIKIIEAMSLGRTILSTTIGAEGIDYSNHKNIFIADTAEEWIAILLQLSKDKSILNQTAIEAQKLMFEKHNTEKLGKELVNHYKEKLI